MITDFFKGFKKGMQNFGENISIIINSTALLLVYFIGVGITFIFSKLLGKKFLETKTEKEKKTYWKKIDWSKKKEDYFKQF